MWVAGFDEPKLKAALASFHGVKRRFDFYINTPQRIYMDDYAHHPNELKATITSFSGDVPRSEIDCGISASSLYAYP